MTLSFLTLPHVSLLGMINKQGTQYKDVLQNLFALRRLDYIDSIDVKHSPGFNSTIVLFVTKQI